MFRASLCPSSGALEYYTSGCCLWCLVFWFSSCRYGVELRVMFPVCGLLQYHLYNTLELLMMGIVVPVTCWASNKICNKNHLLHLVGILFPHINHDARSKSHQICFHLSLEDLVSKVIGEYTLFRNIGSFEYFWNIMCFVTKGWQCNPYLFLILLPF
jgi:hypothetical protein